MVQWEARDQKRKWRKLNKGAFGGQGTSGRGPFVFCDPNSSPASPERTQVPASTSCGLQLGDGSSRERCWGETHSATLPQGQVEFTERLTQRQMQKNQGKDQATDRLI